MLYLAKFARWFLLSLLVPIVAAVFATEPIRRFLDKEGFYDKPGVGWLMSALALIPQPPWLVPAALILGGLTAGVWLDWLLRRFDSSREDRRIAVGRAMRTLHEGILMRQGGFPRREWPGNVYDMRADIKSVFLRAREVGIWAPGKDVYKLRDHKFLSDYCDMVGTLLRRNQFKDAKAEAERAKVAFSTAPRNRNA
jgi:hypothetical protein